MCGRSFILMKPEVLCLLVALAGYKVDAMHAVVQDGGDQDQADEGLCLGSSQKEKKEVQDTSSPECCCRGELNQCESDGGMLTLHGESKLCCKILDETWGNCEWITGFTEHKGKAPVCVEAQKSEAEKWCREQADERSKTKLVFDHECPNRKYWRGYDGSYSKLDPYRRNAYGNIPMTDTKWYVINEEPDECYAECEGYNDESSRICWWGEILNDVFANPRSSIGLGNRIGTFPHWSGYATCWLRHDLEGGSKTPTKKQTEAIQKDWCDEKESSDDVDGERAIANCVRTRVDGSAWEEAVRQLRTTHGE